MSKFTIKNAYFVIDGKPQRILSGAIQTLERTQSQSTMPTPEIPSLFDYLYMNKRIYQRFEATDAV